MRFGIAALGLMMVGSTLPAWAGDGWSIAAQGKKPNREIVVAKDDSIKNHTREQEFLENASRQDRKAYETWSRGPRPAWTPDAQSQPHVGPDLEYEVTTEAVYENTAKPAQLYTTYQINCTRNLLQVSMTMTFWRNKPYDKASDLPVHAPASPLEQQIMRFMCNRGADALSADRRNTLTGLGFTYLGDIGSNASDFAWAKVWSDAKEPAFSQEVMEKNLNRTVENTKASLASAQASVLATGRRMQQIDEESARTKNRVGRSRTLELWIDRSDADFVKMFGAPDQYYDADGGIRTLSYHKASTRTSSSMQPVGGNASTGYVMQQQTSTETDWCDFNLQVRDGKIIDYAITGGNACPYLLND